MASIPPKNIASSAFRIENTSLTEPHSGSPSQSQYKDHFYFAVNNRHLVAALAGNTNIDRLQTCINWLLEGVREERLFQFAEQCKIA